jgi:hypothetical protein
MFIVVYDMYEPCEKHELAFCGECGGQAKAFDESLKDKPLDSSHLPPGVVLAEYPGECAGCGLNFGRESPIRFSDQNAGWVALACCG